MLIEDTRGSVIFLEALYWASEMSQGLEIPRPPSIDGNEKRRLSSSVGDILPVMVGMTLSPLRQGMHTLTTRLGECVLQFSHP